MILNDDLHNGLLIDTNVWLDCFIDSRENHQTAFAMLSAALENHIPLFFSVHSITGIYYCIIQTMKMKLAAKGKVADEAAEEAFTQTAESALSRMMEFAVPVSCEPEDIVLAMKLKAIHRDIVGNMVIAAGQRCTAEYLVTSDAVLLANKNLRALSAAEALEMLAPVAEE